MIEGPGIVDVIESYGVALKRAGRERTGNCSFHADKNPSLRVNPEKGVFYCHACGFGGDAIAFVQKIEGIDFKSALRRLGMENYRPSAETLRQRDEAKQIKVWARGLSLILRDKLRDVGDRAFICRQALKTDGVDREFLCDELQRLWREWEILGRFDDDLSGDAHELWAEREHINHFVDSCVRPGQR